MSVRRTHHNLVWIDLERPSPEEVRALMREFSLDPLLGEELLSPSVRPKAEKYPDYLYVVLHFALGGASPSIHEIDCIVGKRFLITARYANEQGREVFAVPGSPINNSARSVTKVAREYPPRSVIAPGARAAFASAQWAMNSSVVGSQLPTDVIGMFCLRLHSWRFR